MKNLIEKYFNGETSSEEEAQLKAYFNQETIDPSLKEYEPLFKYFNDEQSIGLSEHFDQQLFAKIDQLAPSMGDLIDAYFAGTTTLEQEEQLKAYFHSDEVAQSHKKYSPLFKFFEAEKTLEVSPAFEENVMKKIKQEAKVVSMRGWKGRMLRVAASVAVLLGAYLFLQPPPSSNPPMAIDWKAYEINDEQMAYEETVKALKILSAKLNKGKNKTASGVSKAEPVTKYLN